jgi:2-hydroxychromene-2-carboxylate isomerase
MPPSFDFFYDLGSPYSYLASTQLEKLSERTRTPARLHAITLGGLRKAVGTTLPSPAQLVYMSQDVQLWARRYGVSISIPSAFPTRTVQALRACVAAEVEGGQAAAMHALFRAYWNEGMDIAKPEVISAALDGAGLPGAKLLAASESQEAKDGLRRNTDAALSRGVFGVPAIFVGDRLFFGNDRLEFVEAALRGTTPTVSLQEDDKLLRPGGGGPLHRP